MVLHAIEDATVDFQDQAGRVAIVCVGDSITGWNNFGRPEMWPFPTYPQFLESQLTDTGLTVGNVGIAGEVSGNGLLHTQRGLHWFPEARFFVIGFGTNDLGSWPDTETVSRQILDNLSNMLDAVIQDGKQPMLLNVPPVNESLFPDWAIQEAREKRSYHNVRLAKLCLAQRVPLVDIHSPMGDEHLGDELHPNGEGAKMIARQVEVAIRELLAPE